MAKIVFPKYFMLEAPYIDDTVRCLAQLVSEKPVCHILDYSKVRHIRRGDFLVLVAQIEKAAINKNTFVQEGIFKDQGKIKYWIDRIFKGKGKAMHDNVRDSSFFNNAKLLLPEKVDTLVQELKKIGIKEYFFSFNTFLIEIMGNAVEHGIKNKNINWWLDREVNSKTRTITYTFVDMGQGIIRSHKKAGVPLKYWFLPDSRIVLDAFEGKLGSSTKLAYRGRGLPQLREFIVKGLVSDFFMITNTVTLQYNNDKFTHSKNPDFKGTYFRWTLNLKNYEQWVTSH